MLVPQTNDDADFPRRASAADCPLVAPVAHAPCSRQIPLVVAVAIAHEQRVSKMSLFTDITTSVRVVDVSASSRSCRWKLRRCSVVITAPMLHEITTNSPFVVQTAPTTLHNCTGISDDADVR